MKIYHSPQQIDIAKICYYRQEINNWRDWQTKVKLPGNRLFADNQITILSKKIQTLLATTKPS